MSTTYRMNQPMLIFHLLEVKPGRCKQTVHTKLLQFWESRNVKKGGEMMGVDMLLIDVKQEAQVAGCRSTSEAERYQGRKRKRENKGKWSLDLLSKQLQARCMIWT
ncbi:unnamed protein product [Brassica oleracea]